MKMKTVVNFGKTGGGRFSVPLGFALRGRRRLISEGALLDSESNSTMVLYSAAGDQC